VKVGRIRIKLAERLTKLAKEKWGPDWYVEPDDLFTNAPVYRQVRHDGVSWDGVARREGYSHTQHINSWNNMKDCATKKYVVLCDDGEVLAGDKP
jgi:hypothetical protein